MRPLARYPRRTTRATQGRTARSSTPDHLQRACPLLIACRPPGRRSRLRRDELRLPAEMTVHELFRKLDTLVFHELHVGIAAAVERHADGPRFREYFRVLDGGLVLQRVGVDGGEA